VRVTSAEVGALLDMPTLELVVQAIRIEFLRHTAALVAHGGLELLPLPLLALVELTPLLLVVDVDALAALLHRCPALVGHLLLVGAFFCDVSFLLGRAAVGVSLPSEAVLAAIAAVVGVAAALAVVGGWTEERSDQFDEADIAADEKGGNLLLNLSPDDFKKHGELVTAVIHEVVQQQNA